MPDALTESAYLLKSKVNPFPVAGDLAWRDGRLSFTLGAAAADAVLGWVEEATAQPDLKARLAAGEAVTVFDYAQTDMKVSWPKLYSGSWMQVETADGARTWLVSMQHPSSTIGLLTGRKKGKAWKQALGG